MTYIGKDSSPGYDQVPRQGFAERFMETLFPSGLEEQDQAEGPYMDPEQAVREGEPLPVNPPQEGMDYDPIAVEVTNVTDVQVVVPKSPRDWSGINLTVSTTQAVLISGFNPRKREVILKNAGTTNIALGSDSNVRFGVVGANGSGSFELAPGDQLTLTTCGEIWGVADTTPAIVHVINTLDEGGV